MTKVKICGLTNIESVNVAIDNGADFLGFVFFDKSPRNIAINEAINLANHAREFNQEIAICAVTVNPDDDILKQLQGNFDYIQLHGKEDLERTIAIKNMGFKIIKAFGVENAQDILPSLEYFNIVDYVLYDAKPPKNAENVGGFGISFDWSILETIKNRKNWILSGGLNPMNVKEAIAATNAPFVDVSSGIESALGIKDSEKIAQFLSLSKA